MYIVTDLTRFGEGNPNVCTAMIHSDSGQCVRPMPYFAYDLVRKHGVLPGAIFTGEFVAKEDRSAPHVEDCSYSGLKFVGPATRDQFRSVLENSCQPSISEGFEAILAPAQKLLPAAHRGSRSIVTIRVDPSLVTILPDQYNVRKIKISLTDASGQRFSYLPITDLGFHDLAARHRDDGTLAALNAHIQAADQVFLRVGLSRCYAAPDGRNGYWIQVNGIYTFPSRLNLVRGYAP